MGSRCAQVARDKTNNSISIADARYRRSPLLLRLVTDVLVQWDELLRLKWLRMGMMFVNHGTRCEKRDTQASPFGQLLTPVYNSISSLPRWESLG
jgi:hypothetical protein